MRPDPFPYVQIVPAIGRIMADWPRDKPIGLLLLLPLWNPVTAAEQIGTLAAMSDAPFIVRTAIGSGAGQFAALGADLSSRGRITDASITAMKELFAGKQVTAPDSTSSTRRSALVHPSPSRGGSDRASHLPQSIERLARETPGTRLPASTGMHLPSRPTATDQSS